jgi:hypothetical protein
MESSPRRKNLQEAHVWQVEFFEPKHHSAAGAGVCLPDKDVGVFRRPQKSQKSG